MSTNQARRLRRALLTSLGCASLAVSLLIAAPTAHAAAEGCASGVESDFNGDGRADAAVADPLATVAGVVNAGQVTILYGDADLRVGEGIRRVIRQGAGAVQGLVEAGDQFGHAIAAGDVDCDGYTDLVVGTPFEDIGGRPNSGYLQIVWGAPTGLGTGKISRDLSPAAFGIDLSAGDQFGFAVDVMEDTGQGGTPAPDAYVIAAGAPGYDVAGRVDAGAVGFLAATDGGNVRSWITQDSPGIPGSAEAEDRFGHSVTVGPLTGHGSVDAAIGAPNEDVGSADDAGSVTVINEVYDVPSSGRVWHQDSVGVPGAAETGDKFGIALDSIRVGSTSSLAVGIPHEDVGAARDAGAVQLFSGNGLTLTPKASLTQNTAGVSGTSETIDWFGWSVAFARPGVGNTTTRLAVGAPLETVGDNTQAGMVQVFPLNDLAAETTYHQDGAGVVGVASDGDRFGSVVAVVEGPSERVLLAGVASDLTQVNGMVNVIPFGGGTQRAWIPGIGGVPSGGAVAFGTSLANAGQ